MAATSTPYDRDFYDSQVHASIRSARVILPIVFDCIAPTSVLDVGCGVGPWLRAAMDLGVDEVTGVDGDYVAIDSLMIPEEKFVPADLELPLDLGRRFDLVMSMEVAEHLTPLAADDFVASLVRHGDVVLFSAAIPGQGGTNHLNEQWPAYWAQRFASHGYVATDGLRGRCWLDSAVEPWYAQNALVFVREARVGDLPRLAEALVPGGTPLPLVHPFIFNFALTRPPESPREMPYDRLDQRGAASGAPARAAEGLSRFGNAVLSQRPPEPSFSHLPHVGPSGARSLRALAIG